MSEGYLSSADAPLMERIGGEWHTLPLLEESDLVLIGRQIQAEKKEKALRAVALTATNDRQQINSYFDEQEPNIDDLANYCFTMLGARAIFLASARKGGKSAADAETLFRRCQRERGWRGAAQLAAEASALFPAREREADGKPKLPNRSGAGTADMDAPPAPSETTAAIGS